MASSRSRGVVLANTERLTDRLTERRGCFGLCSPADRLRG